MVRDVAQLHEPNRDVAEAFERAMSLGAEQRRELLRTHAPERPDVARELAELLDAHDWLAERDRVLGVVDGDVVATRLLRETGIEPGSTVGRYRIEAAIGRGSTADVFRGVPVSGDASRVAIKVLRPGLATRDALARFEDERDLIASLEHPCITPIVDAGRLPDGRPWFAMAYIDGLPLTVHCDAARLDIAGRLRLFLKVADAIAYAHRRGVVHRDLKPDNILVRCGDADDAGDAQPAILDFGVARAVGGPRRTDSILEVHRRVLGTPAYMAPEQTRPGHAVGPAADVFALGGVLTELLVGQPPFRISDRSPDGPLALDELFRKIREVPRPGLRVSFLALPEHARRAIAEARGSTPRGLLRSVSDGPSWIAGRAVDLDPDVRYESAGAMAEDVRNALAGRPLSVDPRTLTYRIRLFAKRNRLGLSIGALVLATLGAGLVGTTMQARRAVRAEEATRRQYDAVVAMAEQLVDALPDAIWALPRQTATRRRLLDSGIAALRSAAAEAPDDPRMRRLLATGLASLSRLLGDPRHPSEGEFAQGLAVARESRALWEAIRCDEPDDVGALAAWSNTVLAGANMLFVRGDPECLDWYEAAAQGFADLAADPVIGLEVRVMVPFCHRYRTRFLAEMVPADRRSSQAVQTAARRAAEAVAALPMLDDSEAARFAQADCEQTIAEAYIAAGIWSEARSALERTSELLASIGSATQRPGTHELRRASTERYRMQVEAADGARGEAIAAARRAMVHYGEAEASARDAPDLTRAIAQSRASVARELAALLAESGSAAEAAAMSETSIAAARVFVSLDPDLPGPKAELVEALLAALGIDPHGAEAESRLREVEELVEGLPPETPGLESLRLEAEGCRRKRTAESSGGG